MDAILASKTHEELLLACAETLGRNGHCRIDEAATSDLSARIPSLPSFGFSYWLDPDAGVRPSGEGAQDWLRRSFIHIAFNSALNGGYFEAGPDGGIRQWAVAGSGSRALDDWINAITANGLYPGKHIHGRPEAVYALAPTLEGTPHLAWRLDVAAAFADQDLRKKLLAAYDAAWETGRLEIRLEHADMLAEALPAGFGGDPFRKKAVLAFGAVASLASALEEASCSLPIPSDYQIPRILNWLGCIHVSDGLKGALTGGAMLDPASAHVREFRAAAVIACDMISRAAAIPNWDVDGRLFGAFRKDPGFIAGALPPMRCDSPWF